MQTSRGRPGSTRVTVSDLIAELIGEGLVVETGQREGSRPGKPATMLELNRSAFVIVGVDLSEYGRFRGAVLDLDGVVLAREERERGDAVGAAATALVTELIASSSTGRIAQCSVSASARPASSTSAASC